MLVLVRGLTIAVVLTGGGAGAGEPKRSAMAEPLIGETITDIDGDEPGEGEIDGTAWGAGWPRGIAYGLGELEGELKLTKRVGAAIAIESSGDRSGGAGLGIRAGASLGLLHDFRHDFHLQLEATVQLFEAERGSDGGIELEAPYRAGLRAGYRHHGWLTLRAGAGLAFGGPRTVPLWVELALLGEWGPVERRSFAGVEVLGDFAARLPIIVIPEIAIGLRIHRLPVRVGVGLPITLGYARSDYSLGGLFRLIFEVEPD
jgi:hypothetical protein